MPNKKKKKYNARFPPARIKKIMQKDEEVGKVAAAVPVIISRALELFVASLIRKTSEVTQTRNAKTLTTSHLKQCILTENQFDFLKDLVASVPDVQAEDDSSNPPPASGDGAAPSRLPAPRMKRQQRFPRRRQYGGSNAGPSQTGTEEDSDDDESDSDDDDDDDDEDGSRSEDSSSATKLPFFNHQGFTGHMYGKASPPNGIPLRPTTASTNTNLFSSISVAKLAAPTLDEDYDS